MIDPNVWIAGLINPYGTPARVIEAVMADRITAVVCQELLDELAGVLARPKFRRWISLDQAAAFVETLGARAEHHSDLGPPERRVRDPDDDHLVALADAAVAMLVTGDADLLEAKLDPPATTPRELLDTL
ncbi:putative toxin-antitoxin system toxin component, PIN family [Actinopolymorpha sp. B11F2]|uniref:putative toxin-antitoxin system toxin component, PIN family n=1 Tax=Actinopolymorpha sp. B11F2 TaxID=3160862 RepID=UPI0032E3F854